MGSVGRAGGGQAPQRRGSGSSQGSSRSGGSSPVASGDARSADNPSAFDSLPQAIQRLFGTEEQVTAETFQGEVPILNLHGILNAANDLNMANVVRENTITALLERLDPTDGFHVDALIDFFNHINDEHIVSLSSEILHDVLNFDAHVTADAQENGFEGYYIANIINAALEADPERYDRLMKDMQYVEIAGVDEEESVVEDDNPIARVVTFDEDDEPPSKKHRPNDDSDPNAGGSAAGGTATI